MRTPRDPEPRAPCEKEDDPSTRGPRAPMPWEEEEDPPAHATSRYLQRVWRATVASSKEGSGYDGAKSGEMAKNTGDARLYLCIINYIFTNKIT